MNILETCDAINMYLTERAPRGAYKKYITNKNKEIDNLNKQEDEIRKKLDETRKLLSDKSNGPKMTEALRKRLDNLNDQLDTIKVKTNPISKKSPYYKAGSTLGADSLLHDVNHILDKSKQGKTKPGDPFGSFHADDARKTIKDVKQKFGQGKDNMTSPLENRKPGRFAKESADDYASTKLSIYESWDAGFITDEEKYDLLSILEESYQED